MNNLSQFTNLYPVLKTLRFELKPIGKTLENIEKNGIISSDERRAEEYKRIKVIIDKYHKWFIEEALSKVTLSQEKLEEYYELYIASPELKKDKKWKKDFDKVKKELRKEIKSGFSSTDVNKYYQNLGKMELIRDILPKWEYLDDDEKSLFGDFYKFTTYFTGFNKNRKNMYSDEEKSTAISYRIVNDNLPRFIDNIGTFKRIKKTDLYSAFEEVYTDLEPRLNISSIDEVFDLSYFNEAMSQSEIEVYNYVIGGYSGQERNDKIKGLNEYINEYNQTHEKKDRLPKFKMLYKQILSDREKISFLPDMFESVNDMLDSVETYYKHNLLHLKNDGNEETNVFEQLTQLMSEISSYDTTKIYIKNDKNLTDISNKIFGDYSVIPSAINYYYETVINPEYPSKYEKAKTDSGKERLEKEKEKYTKQKYLSVYDLQSAIDVYMGEANDNGLITYLSNIFVDKKYPINKIDDVYQKYTCVEPLLKIAYSETKKLSRSEKKSLKDFMDSILEIEHTVKPLYITTDEYSDNDSIFYSRFNELYSQLELLIPLYNKVRSFVTKKPYSTEKFKLNFNSPTLLNGWDKNQERSYLGVILCKNNKYFLGIINANNKFSMGEYCSDYCEDDAYKKIVYRQIANVSKDLSTLIEVNGKTIRKTGRINEERINAILEEYKNQYLPENINRIRKSSSYKNSSEIFSKEDLTEYIKYYMQRIIDYKSDFTFLFKEPYEYSSFEEFKKDIERQKYYISYEFISNKDINFLIDSGKLFLFQIYNKDFSDSSKGKKNLHTMYWNALFEESNLNDVVYLLNGQAEIFYRKASIPKELIVSHKVGETMKFRNTSRNHKDEKFKYEIIKDRRYTVDKFQFHVPITMNFKSPGKVKINKEVREYIKDNPDVNILGVDRGERNLIYISLIDQKGNVILDDENKPIQYSLNNIVSKYKKGDEIVSFETPYHTLLDSREESRKQAREQWDDIEGIKELKEGYISQVVSQITRLMVKYNAILVMEDLNFGFKRGRNKVEKQVYQKFEKMLIDKLNYLVFKDSDSNEVGGLYKALQLTDKFSSFKSLGKQTGFIFYVPAWDTSKIDPVTGFVNLFPRCSTVKEKQSFFSKFDSIEFDGKDFLFTFDYDNFTSKANGTRTKWTVSTQGGERYYWNICANNGKGDTEKINISKELEKYLKDSGVELEKSRNIKNDISSLGGNSINFVYKMFNILLSMRYSCARDGQDFILSPVADENGNFFDSRTANENLPKDADANGAYNIARKGLWNIMQLNSSEDIMKANLAISNKEWLWFAQNKPYLDN